MKTSQSRRRGRQRSKIVEDEEEDDYEETKDVAGDEDGMILPPLFA